MLLKYTLLAGTERERIKTSKKRFMYIQARYRLETCLHCRVKAFCRFQCFKRTKSSTSLTKPWVVMIANYEFILHHHQPPGKHNAPLQLMAFFRGPRNWQRDDNDGARRAASPPSSSPTPQLGKARGWIYWLANMRMSLMCSNDDWLLMLRYSLVYLCSC